MCVTVHGVSLHSLELGPLICKEDRVRFYRGTHHGREVVLKVSNTAKTSPIASKITVVDSLISLSCSGES
jgi:hypothetical protein